VEGLEDLNQFLVEVHPNNAYLASFRK